MILMFKQRFFSWFDSYDVFDEQENVVYKVEGEFAWGKRLNVYDAQGNHIATLQQKVLTFFPTFEIYIDGELVGEITKEFSLFRPSFNIDYLDWNVEGEWFEWDYSITDSDSRNVAVISKELFNFTDTYCINVDDPADALHVLMLVLAIDAEKDSRN